MRSVNWSSLATDWVWGNAATGNLKSTIGYGTDGMGTAALLPPVTATTFDSVGGHMYWGDTYGSIRTLLSNGTTQPACLCVSACTSIIPAGGLACASFSPAPISGLLAWNGSLLVGFASGPYGSSILKVSLVSSSAIVTYFCGNASSSVPNNGSACSTVHFSSPQSLVRGTQGGC